MGALCALRHALFQPDPSSNHTRKSRKSTQTDRLTAGQLPNLGSKVHAARESRPVAASGLFQFMPSTFAFTPNGKARFHAVRHGAPAEEPDRDFIFPTGRAWAEDLGYPEELANVLQLRSDFEQDAGKTRVLLLFSPT